MIDEKFKDITESFDTELSEIINKKNDLIEDAKQLKTKVQGVQSAENECRNRIYNKKLEFAKDYITNNILTMPTPKKWDFHRVMELRKALANSKCTTPDERAESLKVLQELKLYVTTFPIVERIAGLLKTWTASAIDISGEKPKDGRYPYELQLTVNGSDPILFVSNRIWFYRDWEDHGYERQSIANFMFRDSDGYSRCGYVDYWEILCAETVLSAEYIVGVINKDDDNSFQYHSTLHKIGSRNGYCPMSNERFSYATDYELAAKLIAYNYKWFKVDDILKAHPQIKETIIADNSGVAENTLESEVIYKSWIDLVYQIIISPKAQVNDIIHKTIDANMLAQVDKIDFDYKSRSVVWTEYSDGDMVFDPDTCEMIHKHGTPHTVSLDGVIVKDIPEYLIENIIELSKYGVVYGMLYVSKHTGIGESSDETYNTDYMTPKNRRVLLDKELSEYGVISQVKRERDYWMVLNFTIALKVPKTQFEEKYKDYIHGSTNNNEPKYRFYPVFDDNKHIVGITAKKPKRR